MQDSKTPAYPPLLKITFNKKRISLPNILQHEISQPLLSLPEHLITFQHGRPIPGTEFGQWAFNAPKSMGEGVHPIPTLKLGTDGKLWYNVLIPGAHSRQDLADLLVDYNRRAAKPMTLFQRQRNASDLLSEEFIRSEEYGPEDHAIVEEVTDGLSDLFFLGAMTDRDLIRVQLTYPGASPEFGKAEVITPHSPLSARLKIPINFAACIRLVDLRCGAHVKKIPGTRARLEHYLKHILGGMITAFFGIYGCSCKNCLAVDVEGKTYGLGWQRVAKAIEEAAVLYLAEDVDLGRQDCWMEESAVYRESFPQASIKTLGLKWSELLKKKNKTDISKCKVDEWGKINLKEKKELTIENAQAALKASTDGNTSKEPNLPNEDEKEYSGAKRKFSAYGQAEEVEVEKAGRTISPISSVDSPMTIDSPMSDYMVSPDREISPRKRPKSETPLKRIKEDAELYDA